MPRELRRIEKLFAELMAQPAHTFPLHGEKLIAPREQGVYLILDARKRVLHVGRTVSGRRGLAQRLRNHLAAQSSFTVVHLKGEGARLRGEFRYRYLVVPDARLRALLEAYAVAHLCPVHLGLGNGSG